MYSTYADIMHLLISQQSNEKTLVTLFEYLQQKISFERILCYKVNRKTKLLTVFIEYSLTEHISNLSYQLNTLAPEEQIKFFKDNPETIVIKNKIKTKKDFVWVEQLHFESSSYIGFLFQVSEDLSSYMFFSCFSPNKNVFTQEHVKILSDLRSILEKIMLDLYYTNPDSRVFLANKISIPNSYEAQLRACPDLGKVVSQIDIIAPYDISVLIRGATGTGKELVATTIHALSKRKKSPFISINCAAIPESLIESELFGFEKGSFTGATQTRKGYFEQANGGTLFLDEIGELSLHSQARLLRVLETKTVQKIGSDRVINLDIRIITATNKNLIEMIENKTFREDLYYRLQGFLIEIPSLNHRKKDIKVLIEYFYTLAIEKYNIQEPPSLSYKTVRELMDYSWSGNIRQLKHAVEESMFKAIASKQPVMSFDFLYKYHEKTSRKSLEYNDIIIALEKSKYKIQGKNSASEYLQVNPATLRSRMNALEIPFKRKQNCG